MRTFFRGKFVCIMAGTTLTLLVIAGQRHEPDCCGWGVDDNAFPEAVAQLRAYFDGELTRSNVELHFEGTEFQRRVWVAVQSIPCGHSRSYASVAEQIAPPGPVARSCWPSAATPCRSSWPPPRHRISGQPDRIRRRHRRKQALLAHEFH
jgi:O6-methylguanine-DNA--protein-cysteine methyltransferase